MEIHYCKYIKERKDYKTWHYSEGEVYLERHGVVGGYEKGWMKKVKPDNLSQQEELDWYIASNNEDKIFLLKESEACWAWRTKEMKDISISQNANFKQKKHG
jgi:hypothetical protein